MQDFQTIRVEMKKDECTFLKLLTWVQAEYCELKLRNTIRVNFIHDMLR